MDIEDDNIPVRYIGRNPIEEGYTLRQRDRDNYHRTVEEPVDLYEMDLNIDGKEVIAVLMVNEEISVKRDRNWGKRNPMIGLCTFTYPTENEEWYKEFKSSLEKGSEVGKAGEELTLDMRKSTINMYIPPLVEEYRKMYKKIISRLYEIKKNTLMNARKKSFDEKLKGIEPEIKLDNIIANLSEEEAKKAKELHDKMVECVLVEKYSWSDYLLFMENLSEIVRKEKVYIANSTINALRKGKQNVYSSLSYSPYYVAGISEEMDKYAYKSIKQSTDGLSFIKVAPIKETYKKEYEGSGIKVLGTLSMDYNDKNGMRIHGEIFGESYNESRSFILIYEDADGNIKFRRERKNLKGELPIDTVENRVKNVPIEDKEIASKQLNELSQSKEVDK